MSSDSQIVLDVERMLWAGRVLSGLSAALLLMSGVMKITDDAGDRQKDLDRYGLEDGRYRRWSWPCWNCAAWFFMLIPQTAVLGAILLTGYLGGACATHVRIGDYGHCWIPVVLRRRRLARACISARLPVVRALDTACESL